MNDFNYSNYSTIMDRLKTNKTQYRRDTIPRHQKIIETLKVYQTALGYTKRAFQEHSICAHFRQEDIPDPRITPHGLDICASRSI